MRKGERKGEEQEKRKKGGGGKVGEKRVGVRKEGDCDLSPIWPRLPCSSTLGVLTTQCPAPSLPITCCWTVAQAPPPGGTWLSVQTKLTLNKFQYTLYKKPGPPLISPTVHLVKESCSPAPLHPWAEGQEVAWFPSGLLCPCIKPSWPLGASV